MAKFSLSNLASSRSASAASKYPKMLNPTATAVILSVAVHGVFFAFGPRTGFSFGALTEAAQIASAEETIVPVVELTPAERSRLPAFAQQRGLSPDTTGLGSLAIPPGLPPIGSNTPSRRTQSNPLPGPNRAQINQRIAEQLQRARRGRNQTPQTGSVAQIRPNTQTPVVPPQPNLQATPRTGPNITATGQTVTPVIIDDNGTIVESPAPAESATEENGNTTLGATLDALEGTNGTGIAIDPGQDPNSAAPSPEEGGPQDVAVLPPDPIDTADAQGNAERLLDGFTYDDTDVSEEAGTINEEEWLAASAEGKTDVETATESITIDSQFKVCKDNPPNEGKIGVLVNPTGEQESREVLRSIGYDLLNRQALDAVSYMDFGQPTSPTQYVVTVNVIYQPEGCVNALPDSPAE